MRTAHPAVNTDVLLEQLAASLQLRPQAQVLRWIRASVGQTVRLISTEDIDYLRSEDKYTQIAWHEEGGQLRDALIRTPLREVVAQLDPDQFAQIHRSIVVNLTAISHVVRSANETAEVHLKRRSEVLPVSCSYLHVFKQM
jgi:DNA-binding LytR/AlgR family response regulator